MRTRSGWRCHFYRGPLGQPDTVRARTVSDARHVSDTARPCARHVSDTVGPRRDAYRPRSIRRGSGVRHCSGPHCVGLPYWATVHFYRKKCSASHGALSTESAPFYGFLGIPRKRSALCRKRRFLKSVEHNYIRSADLNVRTHTRWMRSSPSPTRPQRTRPYASSFAIAL